MREYSRAWLRHEAEAFAVEHLGLERRLGDATAAHMDRLFGRIKTFVRESIFAGTQALVGPGPLDADDVKAASAEADRQDRFLDAFRVDVGVGTFGQKPMVIDIGAAPSPEKPLVIDVGTPSHVPPMVIDIGQPAMTAKQFVARVETYGAATWGAAQNTQRVAVKAKATRGRVAIEEIAVHEGDDEPCSTCSDRVLAGENPLGTLPAIMDSECRCNCHCHFEFRVAPDGPWHVNMLSLRDALDAGRK